VSWFKRKYGYHANITIQFVKRETINRYKGSYLGFLWSFLIPIFMLIIYTFVFSEIFKARWNSENTNKLEFAIILFAGLSTFNIFAEVISRSPSLILGNVNYVKKVVFPLTVFPVIAMGSALVNGSISFVLLIIFKLIITSTIPWTALLLPFILLPLILMTIGLSWFLSSLGVFFRDINYVVGIAVQALMLLSPIFYSVDAIPEKFRIVYSLNPIAYFIEEVRNVLIWGVFPNVLNYSYELIISIIIFLLGFIWFRKTKKGFADVM